jgi:hypothetical protein
MHRRSSVLIIVAVLAAACASVGTPPTPGPALSDAALKYRLIDELGAPAFCDPDEYPVGRDEIAAMRERFPEIERDAATLVAITARLGIAGDQDLGDDERLAIYRQWKLLNAIGLAGPDRSFDLLVGLDPNTGAATRVTGTITEDGRITVIARRPGEQLMCPICLAVATRIATPAGDIRVEDVRVGMTVWSVDADGRRIEAVVVSAGRTPVPASHEVVRLQLADGRAVRASAGHPLADGRRLGSLTVGDEVDGAVVVAADLQRYAGGFTYDLRTSGPTGAYIADGIAMGSTLEP